ncbi:GNAT family N-acetyltransferase [Microbacterium sp.]|uniref:GNAT family N-acetyltransferase n=1 Tax=Microbacterium sp. TaxID=51671 RepID=UPI003A8AE895
MAFLIRAPRPEEADTLAELHVATWREAYGDLLPEGYLSPAHIAGRHRMWAELVANPRGDVTARIAVSGDSILGFALAGPAEGVNGEAPPRDLQLYSIYTLAAHHGVGAGQALLDAVLGGRPAMLWVASQNARAIAFYQRNDFRFDGVELEDPDAPLITDARMVR